MIAATFLALTSAALAQPSSAPLPVTPPPRNQQGVEPGMINVPYQETVTLEMPGVTRVLSVNPAIVEATLVRDGIVQLRAVAFGQTFLHAWSATGRATRVIQVIQPISTHPTIGQLQKRQDATREHLTLEYQSRYRTIRRGPHVQDTDLTTSNQLTHDIVSQMETPFGHARGQVAFQRLNNINELASWSTSLTDGRIGPLKRFALFGGDTGAGLSDLSLPESTIRGVNFRYEGVPPFALETFHGRRRFGFGLGAPGVDVQDDVFFSGAGLEDQERPWTWGVGYATASGTSRPDITTSQAVEARSWYWPSETAGFGAEIGRNNEAAYAYRLKSAIRGAQFNMDAVYRNLSQRFDNLLGQTAEQGERGWALASQWVPWRPVRLSQRIDVYQDWLFANPEEPGLYNQDLEFSGDLDVTRSTVMTGTYGRQRLLGRLFPTDTTTIGAGVRQRLGKLPLVADGSLYADYLYRDTRNVNAPTSDFNSHSIRVGLGAPITATLAWQVSQLFGFIEDDTTGTRGRPQETSIGVNYFQQFERLPLHLRSGLNFTRSSGGDSVNSFLSNEDRWIWDSGARYKVSPDFDVYVDSRLLRRNQRDAGREYEIEMETGMRYFFDTGVSWEPSAKLSGLVFQDLNGDGARQPEEPGLPNIAVTADAQKRAVTDPGGRFYLGTVRGKHAEVAIDLSTTPQGFVPTTPSAMDIDLAAPPKQLLAFGLVAQSELRVRVFVDANGNGRYDATDAPIEGVRVTLDGKDTQATDRSGWIFFRGMAPGAHRVALTVADLKPGLVPASPVAADATLREGKAELIDFPIGAERSIAGRVYVDGNRNAIFDRGEQPLADVPMCLDAGERRVRTREDGRYLFKGVSGGVHRVRLNCGATLRGFMPLNATVQVVELPVQATQRDRVDFQLSEAGAMMQDITADVLRARQQQEQLIQEMIDSRRNE